MKKWKNVLYAAIASMFAMTAIVVDLSALPKETTSLKAYLSHCLFTDSLVDACVYALMFLLLLAGAKRRTKSVRCSVCALAMAGIHIVSGLFLNGNVSPSDGKIQSYNGLRRVAGRVCVLPGAAFSGGERGGGADGRALRVRKMEVCAGAFCLHAAVSAFELARRGSSGQLRPD